MKRLIQLAAVSLSLTLGLAGCAVYTPHGAVVVDPHHGGDNGASNGKGNFCPPGQAKKGRC
jgi:hypothetical protein